MIEVAEVTAKLKNVNKSPPAAAYQHTVCYVTVAPLLFVTLYNIPIGAEGVFYVQTSWFACNVEQFKVTDDCSGSSYLLSGVLFV